MKRILLTAAALAIGGSAFADTLYPHRDGSYTIVGPNGYTNAYPGINGQWNINRYPAPQLPQWGGSPRDVGGTQSNWDGRRY